jgi:hypothetical protein
MRSDSFWAKVVQDSRARRPLFRITARPWWTEVLVAAGAKRARTDDSMTVEFREGSQASSELPQALPGPEAGFSMTIVTPRHDSDLRRAAELFRDGSAVVMDLTEMNDADVQRAVHFSTGLVQGLRGSLQRLSDVALILTPESDAELLRPTVRLQERVLALEGELRARAEAARGEAAWRVDQLDEEPTVYILAIPGTSSGPESGLDPETDIGSEPFVSPVLRQRLMELHGDLATRVMQPDELTREIEDVLNLLRRERHRKLRPEVSRGVDLLLQYLTEYRRVVVGRHLAEPFHMPDQSLMAGEIQDVLRSLLELASRRESSREIEDRVDRLRKDT